MRIFSDDTKIKFRLMDGNIAVGTIEHSRMRYQEMVYYVKLDYPVKYTWRSEPTLNVMVNQSYIIGEV